MIIEHQKALIIKVQKNIGKANFSNSSISKGLEKVPGFRKELLEEPFVLYLLDKLFQLSEELEELKAEVRTLKKLPKKPKIKPSNLDKPNPKGGKGKERKTGKRKKKENLSIHDTKDIKLADPPIGWKLVGYKSCIIQDIIVRAHNIEYKLEKWQSPDGAQTQIAVMPEHLQNTHFGAQLKAYILHQYHECVVTQPLILSSLRDFGVDISSGQISAILTENKEEFHAEKETLLSKGIELSEELRTDDTGAKHRFKNGFCNCINSSLFTYFTTTYSKSRINFLEILRQGRNEYHINKESLSYIENERLTAKYCQILKQSYDEGERVIKGKTALEDYFKSKGITAQYAKRQITEALLIGAILEYGFDPNTVIHSDGAGQFNIFIHSLCWKHAERPLIKLKYYNPVQQDQLESKKAEFWLLYQRLKIYKEKPNEKTALQLSQKFDELCEPVTGFGALNHVFDELKKKKDQLLVVLKRPNTSLHNNDSERDIREYVKRRKISAGTRSDNGKMARDTFLSLKKTCRKLNVSFWEYLNDRLRQSNLIPPLSQIMFQKHQLSLA